MILFEDQFDLGAAGEDPWGPNQSAPGSLTYVNDPVFGPRNLSMRNRLVPGDIDPATGNCRSELTGVLAAAEGVERWFRLPVRLDQWSLQAGIWGLIWQQHLGLGSPPLALFMREAVLSFRLANGITDENHWLYPISLDTWYDIVIGVKFSTNPAVGWIEVWLDGVQQTLEGGLTRRFARTATTSAGDYALQNYDKLGLYTANMPAGFVRDVYHGMYRVGTTRESVIDPVDVRVLTSAGIWRSLTSTGSAQGPAGPAGVDGEDWTVYEQPSTPTEPVDLGALWLDTDAPDPSPAILTFRTGQTWVVAGTLTGGQVIPPFFIPVVSGQIAKIIGVRAKLGGGSIAAQLTQNGTNIGSSVTVTSTKATTTFGTPVTMVDGDEIGVALSSPSGSPANLSLTVILEHS